MLKYICYNWMPTIANHTLDTSEDHYREAGTSRLHAVDDFNPYLVRDNDLIFVKTDFIVNGMFQKEYLDKIFHRFNLITGVSSYNLGRDGGDGYKHILDHPNLNRWICTNPPNIENSKIIPIPIGFQENDRPGGEQAMLEAVNKNRTPFDKKKDLIFLPHHTISTNLERRGMVERLKSLPFVVAQETKQSLEDYYAPMDAYKFVIGLEGRGPDIHRSYEAMLVGSIPINVRNVISKVFNYHNAEAVFLNSWEELTDNMFNKLIKKKYNILANDNFLLLSSHISRIKDELT